MNTTKSFENIKSNTSLVDKIAVLFLFLMLLSGLAFTGVEWATYLSRLAFVLFVFLFVQVPIRLNHNYTVWGSVFVLLCFLSIIWAYDRNVAILEAFKVFQNIIIGIALISWIKDKNRFIMIIKITSICTSVLCFRVLIESGIIFERGHKVVKLLELNVNTISGILAFSFIILLFLTFQKNINLRMHVVWGALCIIHIGVILILASRRALTIILMAMILFTFLQSSRKKKFIFTLLVGIVVIISLIYLIHNNDILYMLIGNRIDQSIATFFATGSVLDSTRTELIDFAGEMFLQKPILGWGIGNFKIVSGMGMYSHNNYFELLSCLGLVGFFIYYSLHICIIIDIIQAVKTKKNISISITILICTIFSDYAMPGYSVFYTNLFLTIAVAALQYNIE